MPMNRDRTVRFLQSIDEYKCPIIDMFLFLYDQYEEGYVTLDADMDEKLTDLYNTLHDAQLQLQERIIPDWF